MTRVFATILAVSQMIWTSPVFPHAKPGENKHKPNELEGIWTLVSEENEGRVLSFLPRSSGNAGDFVLLWKISKDEIDMGNRYAYELNPKKQPGTIDLIRLDKDGKKILKDRGLAIYFIKDDWLFICEGQDKRPDAFTTSGKPSAWFLLVLRRGELK
jgi:uncharacterized protein (TIGR03067 family)